MSHKNAAAKIVERVKGNDNQFEKEESNSSGMESEELDSVQSDAMGGEWWEKVIHSDDVNDIVGSHKFQIVLKIIEECQQNKDDKCLIFSLSLATLDVLEYFLGKYKLWKKDIDYHRLDGSTSQNKRKEMITDFNESANVKLFLISSKAGGQGINLTAANRIILVDTSWNPSTDRK